ncbi:MAG TPA: D-alanyl-D-alanine carboxypeptidase/D-alanyl-D-alanine-endopeptidase [Rhizomicrobium sp.]|nr:D-alanyl-D-alanine carboxypeptidase/D-alanyl-D-alanine-endopeptidase [Rhizomicrobium sp.]
MRGLIISVVATLTGLGAIAQGQAQDAAPQAPPAPKTFIEAVKQVTSRPAYAHANWGLEVWSVDEGKPLYVMNGDKLFIPGSTTKLFTEGSALYLLGPDYRFHTPLYRTGRVDKAGVLHGDLILVGSGDPNLSDRVQPNGTLAFADEDHTYGGADSHLVGKDPIIVLHELAKAVKAAGIKRIAGKVRVDISLFPEGDRDLGTGETISPVIVNDNAIDITYGPGAKEGDAATFAINGPAVPYIHFVNKITTIVSGKGKVEDPVTVDNKDGSQTVTVTGTVEKTSGPVILAYAVSEPSRFAGVLMTRALRDEGIKLAGKPDAIKDDAAAAKVQRFYSDAMKVGEHVSTPLATDVHLTLKVSHNLHASTMPFVMGAVLAHAKEKIDEAGFAQERMFLEKAGLDLSGASQADGAGGAGTAYYTPDFVVRYLDWMAHQPHYQMFHDSLPVLGKDGTLVDIQKQSPAVGKVFAKTGTYGGRDLLNGGHMLTGKGLAGYTTTVDGRHLAFAFYVNHVELKQPSEISDSSMAGQALGELSAAMHLLPIGTP